MTPTGLSPSDEKAALALARALLPPGRVMPAGNEKTVAGAVAFLGGEKSPVARGLGTFVRTLDAAAVLRTGRRFQNLSAPKQEELIKKWESDPVLRWPVFALGFLFKSTHFDDPEIYQKLGCVYHKGGPSEPARWMQQVFRGEEVEDGEEIECDVVVVGTGAGGAIVGKELAEKGYAVVFLEEGEFHRRESFTGNALSAHKKFYRNGGGIFTLGNNLMPIFMGRMVGGSTAINTATCFRTPPWILDQWCEKLGSDELAPERMKPHFDHVEQELRVQPNDSKYIGAIGQIVGRGCDKLGWHHFPVPRNAPDCDGQGVCDFGCPTDAKRSTNISYIPPALTRGAILYTGMKATKVRIENGRAVGLQGRAVKNGKTLWIRARATILSGGSIPTPMLLLSQGICNSSGQVGRNLSVHPSTAASALFDEKVDGFNHIPQGYGCDQFHKDGILLLGAQASINVGGILFPFSGRRFMDVMDRFDRVASFGVLVEDETQNGRVRLGPGGGPLVTYNMTKKDVSQLQKGISYLAKIFFAAGADKIFPLLPRIPVIEGEAGLKKFEQMALKPWDFLCTSWHPLGTCKMGKDPKTSVIGLDHEAHDLKDLFIVDGSSVPGPPAVNSQETIMGMADRAAGKIAEKLEARG